MLLHPKLRATRGLFQPVISYVGGHSATVSGTHPSIAIDSLTGGSGSAAQVDDLVIGLFALRANTTNLYSSSGWDGTLGQRRINTIPRIRAALFYRRLTSPTTSVQALNTTSGANHEVVVQVWRGFDLSAPIDVAAITPSTGTGAPSPPGITTSTTGALIVVAGISGDYNDDLAVPNNDYGFFRQETGATNLRIALAARNTGAAGVYTPPAFAGGNASARYIGMTTAIRPG